VLQEQRHTIGDDAPLALLKEIEVLDPLAVNSIENSISR
jgi:hypothetical protein